MQRLSPFILIILLGSLFFSCSKKKEEAEYFALAKEQYSKEAFKEAVINFKNIIEYYPDGKHAAEATFMIGFIYANSIKDFDEAKKYYTAFIEKYPNHDLADDANYELKTLGQDINELPIFKNSENNKK